eukprot:TRINITY_DN631_c0_g1_i8.p1 TRINITY_DN631_c0_g1~~TRINITY_DN631_c0_g1_i8.p1  ORF type:complete len:273 (-),score=61.85 TRINITY_DN631_c0_g1_i8:110-928(-)
MNSINTHLLQLPSHSFSAELSAKAILLLRPNFNSLLSPDSSYTHKESYEWLNRHLGNLFSWMRQAQTKRPINFDYKPRFPDITNYYPYVPLRRWNEEEKMPSDKPEVRDASRNNHSDNAARLRMNEFTLSGSKIDAYKRRNVYKSIIRHMQSYIQENRGKVLAMLKDNDYSDIDANSAFEYISRLNDIDKQKGKAKRPQYVINKLLRTRNIYTHILKETLYSMLASWKSDKTRKIMQKNLYIYNEVCTIYYNRCTELLSQSNREKSNRQTSG